MSEVTPFADAGGRIEPRELEQEMRTSFLDYAMSVIVARALPDVRDGLKPVHRRILYAMHEAGLQPNRPRLKCARVVGDVMGYYHPHGDQAIYPTLVHMAQPWAMREKLVDGKGNFGSVEDDPPASPWAWPPTWPRTTLAKSSTASVRKSRTRRFRSRS